MITSQTNPRIKNIVQLQQKSKARREQDCFVIEGENLFLEVPLDSIVEAYYTKACLLYPKQEIIDKLAGLVQSRIAEEVSEEVFKKISDTQSPQGILCVVKRSHYEIPMDADSYILLENLQDPGNLGTIIRTAEGAGVGAVLLSEGCVDLYSPKTVRATMGSLFRMTVCTDVKLLDCIEKLRARGVKVYATYLPGSVPYTEPDYSGPTAFVIGNEGNGLTTACAEACDERIRIPMSGQLESLNASVAAALVMYECKRQR